MESVHHGNYPNTFAFTLNHTNIDRVPTQDYDYEFGATFIIEMYEEDSPQSEDYIPFAPPYVLGSTPEDTTMQEIQAQLPQNALALDTHWPPIPAPQLQGASTLGSPWPTAVGLDFHVRTQAHYNSDELAGGLANATPTATRAAPPSAAIAPHHGGGYTIQDNIVAPQPRYASRHIQRTQSAPPETRFGVDVPPEGPQSAPAYFVWSIAEHTPELQPQTSTGQQMQNLYRLPVPGSQDVPSFPGHHVPSCRRRQQPGTSHRHGHGMD
ncbi:uncharacterized protein PHACADRAFT_208690 [Phanerochaete carnosa HHB-10118-sp]|uniref:Uncharacterized protein n=1 Tax=Phanerochaete carnosa (strain HHB-10118-sp) TaxID=650164 RepID=K5UYE9_PHACS|nr:uncharacterized protein PHACADRAFT_208690 [Phanerochaete carnosa HHB-10118-sp]EKM55166.1 hypothetical protein PHACADRAFT_208690 [Phanerochaete carnosa HHB-10118-sp]